MLFQTICLAGGGVGGFAHLGFLQAISQHQSLKSVDTWVGCSIGALVCLLSSVGLSPQQISTKFEKLNEGMFNFRATAEIHKKLGMDEGEYIKALLYDLIIEVGLSPSLTFAELKEKKSRRLIVCVTNVNAVRAEYFSPETHPDLSVVKAVRASMGVPPLLTPVEHTADGATSFLTDGGVSDNFPLRYALTDFTSRFPGREPRFSVVGCNLVSPPVRDIKDFVTYILAIISCVRRQDAPSERCYVDVEVSDGDAFDFSAPVTSRRRLFNEGARAGEAFITSMKGHARSYITRRRSF